jgi:hypothetical protein
MKTLLLSLVFLSSQAFAWGPTGHRVVGQVAEKELEREVLKKITEILDGASLARVSTWPDEIKSEPETYSETYIWHYTDWPEGVHDHDEAHSSGKLLTSIKEQLTVLKDPGASKEKKSFAIKFIVHLVGDLHQPLHVGNGLDQGGNNCKVTFMNKSMSLHVLWDSALIDFSELSFTELANFISQGKTRSQIEALKRGTLVDWARESKLLRASLYPADKNPSPNMSVRNYCRKDIVILPEEMPKLSYEYSYKFMPVLERRLFEAGIRLAHLLNEALR